MKPFGVFAPKFSSSVRSLVKFYIKSVLGFCLAYSLLLNSLNIYGMYELEREVLLAIWTGYPLLMLILVLTFNIDITSVLIMLFSRNLSQ